MNMDDAAANSKASSAAALREIVALERKGELDQAAAHCRELLRRDSDNADAWFQLSGIEQQRKRSDAALDAIDHAIASDAQNAPALCRRGSILRVNGRVEEAAESHRRALAVDPNYVEAHNNLGNCLRDLQRFAEAAEHYRQAVTLKPDYAQAHNNLGVTLRELDRDDEAIRSLFRALTLKPDYVNAQLNLGTTLLKQQKYAEAEGLLRRVVAKSPNDGTAHLQLAGALMQMGRSGDAEPILQRAIALVPDQADAEFDLALMLLSRGRFKEGWKHYESRWRLPENLEKGGAKEFRRSIQPWEGEPLDGKRILVQAEQGLGDGIQFCRYVPLLAARGARVTLLVARHLVRLLSPIAAVAEVTWRIESRQHFDYRASLLGLPRVFQTDLDTIPRTEGPYLFAEADRIVTWRERIGVHGYKIAVCWQGTPNTRIDKGRSIPIGAFAPLARLPGVRLISVQKRHGLDQLERLPEGMRVETLGSGFDEGSDAFLDTAGVMANCDLIVTSDTSVAHLAGALDRPTWVGLSTTADWRWLKERRDSPWYRSVTLFRQQKAGDWSTVFAEMAASLGGVLGAKT